MRGRVTRVTESGKDRGNGNGNGNESESEKQRESGHMCVIVIVIAIATGCTIMVSTNGSVKRTKNYATRIGKGNTGTETEIGKIWISFAPSHPLEVSSRRFLSP
jgi:hypothetical protein